MTFQSKFEIESCLLHVSEEEHDSHWDSFLCSYDCGHHVQSSLWSKVKALNGWKTRRIIMSDGQQIVGGAQLLTRKVKYFGTIGYIPKGPVLSVDDESLAGRLLDKVVELAAVERLRVLFAQPPEFGVLIPLLAKRGFESSPVELAPSATVLIDLTNDLDSILTAMPKGIRNHIRRSQKRGVRVRVGTKEDLPTFHRLLLASGRRGGFSAADFKYFLGMWEMLDLTGGIKIFIGELDKEAVSAQICILFGNTVVAKRIGWSGQHGHLHPNEALDWYTIQWAKNNGFRYYDLEGIERPAAEALINGNPLPEKFIGTATSYKLRLGGEAVLFPTAYCFIANPIFQSLFKRVGIKAANSLFVQKAVGRFRTRE